MKSFKVTDLECFCYKQIPFLITQHVKHKASALITSTLPPTSVLLPLPSPQREGRVGEGLIFSRF